MQHLRAILNLDLIIQRESFFLARALRLPSFIQFMYTLFSVRLGIPQEKIVSLEKWVLWWWYWFTCTKSPLLHFRCTPYHFTFITFILMGCWWWWYCDNSSRNFYLLKLFIYIVFFMSSFRTKILFDDLRWFISFCPDLDTHLLYILCLLSPFAPFLIIFLLVSRIHCLSKNEKHLQLLLSKKLLKNANTNILLKKKKMLGQSKTKPVD